MAKPKQARTKRTKKVVEAEGVAHIKATFNNTIITIADSTGRTVSWGTAGKVGFKGSKKSTPFAAQLDGSNAAKEAMSMGLRKVEVWVKGPGSGREAAIRSLTIAGLPQAIASRIVLEIPSATDGRTKMSIAAISSGTSSRSPGIQTRSSIPSSLTSVFRATHQPANSAYSMPPRGIRMFDTR